jgi:pseudaminic acid biosynthesis-associated methylase
MADFQTEQEAFWAGQFGNDYIARNNPENGVAGQIARFAKIIERTQGVNEILELGANIGMNAMALKALLPRCKFGAVEINAKAVEQLRLIENVKAFLGSIFDFTPQQLGLYDMTFTSGVLIHINPEFLPEVYRRLYECSRKYVTVIEYYNPAPVEVSYRGHGERLFKRDFAGDLMERYPDLKLVDYGFCYRRDPNFPADDTTWFLMEKR